MTAAVLDRPRPCAERLGSCDGGRSRSRSCLNAALDEARANGSTECPVCHARMTSTRARARARRATRAAGAECGGCGSRLS